ncbi:hypothetical protein SORDD14_00453 [Streptococcus oralis]|uniref:Uncharacterized protein n=1 Tax=Streptococcus oralis TaxID=1303 RepID=A0A139P5Q1_STROR|nr:hypothetical protein [Streptococcus oralis]KXT83515.1 hypothetical protein SORDD14_00453 [Streptococcus oralis]
MKEFFRILKESDKLGYKLSAICGVNWLVGQLFKWQSLVFEMIACAVLIKEISAILDISSNYLGFLMVIFILAVPFLKLRFGVEKFIYSFFESIVLVFIFSIAVDSPFQENESSLWVLIALISIGIYQFVNWFQAKLFQRYLFKNVLNKEYLGIKKATDPFPSGINFYVDAGESDANRRMVMINKRAVKEAYQGIVELSFLNVEKFTGISHYRVAWKGFEAPFEVPLKKGFSDVDEMYHLVFRVYPFGEELDFYFKLIRLDLSRRKAFTVQGVAVKVVNK